MGRQQQVDHLFTFERQDGLSIDSFAEFGEAEAPPKSRTFPDGPVSRNSALYPLSSERAGISIPTVRAALLDQHESPGAVHFSVQLKDGMSGRTSAGERVHHDTVGWTPQVYQFL